MDKDLIQNFLNTSARVLHAIEVADLEAYIAEASRNNDLYDSIGPIVDPTRYRNDLHSGRRDQLRVELEIARKQLEIRKLLDQLQVES